MSKKLIAKYDTEKKLKEKLKEQSITLLYGRDDIGNLFLHEGHMYIWRSSTDISMSITYSGLVQAIESEYIVLL